MKFRTAEMMLFDTCTHKCAYCHFAESGKVLDNSQIRPYRDAAFIEQIASFFAKRTTDEEKWRLILTGGEPLLMPNFSIFARRLNESGNKIALNTALLVGDNHPSIKYLLEDGPKAIDYIMASFHPEAEEIEDAYFARLRRLKQAGHSVIFRLVGHPERLHRLDELSSKCREIDVAFHPTPLFSPIYPSAYTEGERQALQRHAVSLSQVIQVENGIDTSTTLCAAGSDIISIDMRSGNITPCVSVHSPVIGNMYDDDLRLVERSIRCPKAGISCACDIHFQQNIVHGADDRANFEAEKRGFVEPKPYENLRQEITDRHLRFSTATPGIGQTETASFQALSTDFVKDAYNRSKDYFHGGYASNNHAAFKSRQFPTLDTAAVAETLPEPAPRQTFWERLKHSLTLN